MSILPAERLRFILRVSTVTTMPYEPYNRLIVTLHYDINSEMGFDHLGTRLVHAAHKSLSEEVSLLLDLGADPNPDPAKRTTRHC